MKKPYEYGYYDGYQDCKRYYENLLIEVEEDKEYYKEQVKYLEWRLNHILEEQQKNNELIRLGKAVKIFKESLNDCHSSCKNH